MLNLSNSSRDNNRTIDIVTITDIYRRTFGIAVKVNYISCIGTTVGDFQNRDMSAMLNLSNSSRNDHRTIDIVTIADIDRRTFGGTIKFNYISCIGTTVGDF